MSNPHFAMQMSQMAYHSKTQPPEDLLGLWTMDGTLNDLSRYKNNLLSTTTVTYYDEGYGKAVENLNSSIPCNISGDFSLDWMVNATPEYAGHNLFVVGSMSIRSSYAYGQYRLAINDNYLTPAVSGNYLEIGHAAIVRRNGVIYVYLGGAVHSQKYNLPDTIQNISVNSKNQKLQNVRLVGKAIGTTSSFPVPSSLYTGYETL